MLNCSCPKNCNRVNYYSTITVFIEKRGARVRDFFSDVFSKGFDLIDYLSLIDCKKNIITIKIMRRMTAQELSRSVGMVQAELGSQLVCFQNNKTGFSNS